MIKRVCETCIFWHQPGEEETSVGRCWVVIDTAMYKDRVDENSRLQAGECHRRAPVALPPVVVRNDYPEDDDKDWPENAVACWPVTLPLDWCGEWQGEE